jgi:hypothetical protein
MDLVARIEGSEHRIQPEASCSRVLAVHYSGVVPLSVAQNYYVTLLPEM